MSLIGKYVLITKFGFDGHLFKEMFVKILTRVKPGEYLVHEAGGNPHSTFTITRKDMNGIQEYFPTIYS